MRHRGIQPEGACKAKPVRVRTVAGSRFERITAGVNRRDASEESPLRRRVVTLRSLCRGALGRGGRRRRTPRRVRGVRRALPDTGAASRHARPRTNAGTYGSSEIRGRTNPNATRCENRSHDSIHRPRRPPHPLSEGGRRLDPHNCRASCRACNLRRAGLRTHQLAKHALTSLTQPDNTSPNW